MTTRRPLHVTAVVVATLACTLTLASGAGAQADDPTLDQRIDVGQNVATGPAVLSTGHVDIGPVFIDGTWQLMIHDDSVDPSVWRSADDVVFEIGDAGRTEAPADPNYSFIGAKAGDPVHVVSQTQQPDVVWIGWNTQAPSVLDRIDRGATLTLLGAQGPGEVSVYLQSGNFSAPEVLWQSSVSERQPLWVDVNTHTHANWVFTEPGIYLLRVEAAADLVNGDTVSDTVDLRVSVGDDTDPTEALSAEFTLKVADEPESASAPGSTTTAAQSGGSTLVLGIVGAAALALIVAVAAAVVRGRRVRRQARDRSTMAASTEPMPR